MLETGGGGGGTPWESMTLDKMRELIQNPNPDAQWKLARAWQRSAELLNFHRAQVLQYRESLAAAWPPEKSAASAAYLERLDQLINNITETYEASIVNHTAFSTVTSSINQAQAQLDKIYQEYQVNKATAVAPERQEELRLRAVDLLRHVSNDLAEAQLRIAKPPAYQPGRVSEEDPHPIESGRHVPPHLPPITPTLPVDGTATGTSSRVDTSLPAAVPSGVQPGLILGGVGSPPSTTTPPSGVIPLTPSADSAAPLNGHQPIPPVAGFIPAGVRPIGPPSARTGVGRGTGLPPDGVLRPSDPVREGMRTTAPGGIIGGVPAGASRQPRRINPIGRGAGSRRGSAGGTSPSGHLNGLYGRGIPAPPDSRRGCREKPWNPDNPWETEEGVAPVLLPARDKRIDPGPVIGLT